MISGGNFTRVKTVRNNDKEMENNIHELKTWKEYFHEVLVGRKTFEVRKNDRDFKKGDTLILKEWDNEKQEYTGRQTARGVSYVLHGGQFGIEDGYVVMSIT